MVQMKLLSIDYLLSPPKRKGIGTALLTQAEECMKNNGITVSKVHLGTPKADWYESYSFYLKHGYLEYEERYMRKLL